MLCIISPSHLVDFRINKLFSDNQMIHEYCKWTSHWTVFTSWFSTILWVETKPTIYSVLLIWTAVNCRPAELLHLSWVQMLWRPREPQQMFPDIRPSWWSVPACESTSDWTGNKENEPWGVKRDYFLFTDEPCGGDRAYVGPVNSGRGGFREEAGQGPLRPGWGVGTWNGTGTLQIFWGGLDINI